MKAGRVGAAIVAVAMFALAGCGGDDGGSDGGSGSDSGGLKIGIKFDQPGLGLKVGEDYTGLDVDVATYVADQLGTSAEDITWVQAPSAQRETLIESGQVDLVVATYSITDERKELVELRRTVLRRRPGPAGPSRRLLHHRPGVAGRQEALLGHRLHLGAERRGRRPRRQPA